MQEEKYADLVWDHDEDAHKKFIANLAPIVLFTYNRLEHTKKTIAALQQNMYAADSELYIYSDGPKNDAAKESVEAVRLFLHQVDGFKQVHIIERDKNWGLAENIIDGVTSIVNKYGKIIVLEDDIVTSKYFLKYMNDALEVYKDMSKVMAVSGYCWTPDKENLPETFFLPWFACWGWGTWKRSWEQYERNPKALVEHNLICNRERFNFNGSYDAWSQVEKNYNGELYTWAVFFSVTIFVNDGLIVYSNHDQCKNIGMDGTGENCGEDMRFDRSLEDIPTRKFSLEVSSTTIAEQETVKFFREINYKKNIVIRVFELYKNKGIQGIYEKIRDRMIRELLGGRN